MKHLFHASFLTIFKRLSKESMRYSGVNPERGDLEEFKSESIIIKVLTQKRINIDLFIDGTISFY